MNAVKRLLSFTILLFLALAAAPLASARAHQMPQTKAQKQAQKDWQKWNKQQLKIGRQQIKIQNKQMKNWNRTHPKRSVAG